MDRPSISMTGVASVSGRAYGLVVLRPAGGKDMFDWTTPVGTLPVASVVLRPRPGGGIISESDNGTLEWVPGMICAACGGQLGPRYLAPCSCTDPDPFALP